MPGDSPAPVHGSAEADSGPLAGCLPTDVPCGGAEPQAAVTATMTRHATDSRVGDVRLA